MITHVTLVIRVQRRKGGYTAQVIDADHAWQFGAPYIPLGEGPTPEEAVADLLKVAADQLVESTL